MMPWRILDYVNERGENEIQGWIRALPPKARAKIAERILVLRHWPDKTWPLQYVSALRGYAGICEFRIVAFGVQYRPLGCYGPGEGEYTLLAGAIEKGGRLQPPGVGNTAVHRRTIIFQDRSRVHEHEFR